MAKENWRLTVWACGFILAMAGLVAGSGAYAQTGWSIDASRSEPDAKRTPPPPPIQIAGSWDGTIQDPVQGIGAINLTFTERSTKTKGILKGTWTVNFNNPPNGAINDVGTLTGSVIGSTVAMTLIPRRGDALGNCRNIFNAVNATQDMISGTFHFSGCGENHTGPISVQPGPAPTLVFVNIGDDFFFPPRVTISAGQTVRWTNNGSEDHTVTSNAGSNCRPSSNEAFDSSTMDSGTTFDHTFNNPGTFAYYCQVHGCPMRGTITVQ